MTEATATDAATLDLQLKAHIPWYWVHAEKLSLGGKPYTKEGHEYQVEWLIQHPQRECYMKGAQIGATESNVIKTMHGLITGRYPQGALYLFPTRDDVTDFSQARFQPFIRENPQVSHYVQDTDRVNIKRVGKGILYLRGARAQQRVGGEKKSASQLKSIPVDKIVYDEVDEMDPAMVDLAHERLAHSRVQEETFLSTPTIPDFGIDKLYQNSDQRVWELKCGACGTYTCLELEFPQCLKHDKDGKVYRACKKCGGEVNPKDGKWTALYPERSEDMVGWWLSQLNSVFVDPGTILKAYEDPDTNMAEFWNSKLGKAYISAENRLKANEVWSICSNDAMMGTHKGPTCMGVDVGRVLHVLIGDRPSDGALRVVYATRVAGFNDVHDLAKKFNVRCAVVDREPETREARRFQAGEKFDVFLCDYNDHQRGAPKWDFIERLVTVNRTEICDNTHEIVVSTGKLILPRRSDEIEKFVSQMCNIAKVREENDDTGSVRYVYRKLGEDHYRHALNYLVLASQQIGLNIERLFGMIRRKKHAISSKAWT